MNEQQPPGGGQYWPSASYNDAIARELGSLKQALDHLATIERDLERQRVQLQAQVTRYTEQAPLARQANRHDLANEALARAAQLQPELTRIQEQMSRVVARQREITNRQFDLLRQAHALGSEQIAPVSNPYPSYYAQSPYAQPQSPYAPYQSPYAPPQTPAPRKPKKRRRLLIGLTTAATLIVLAALGLAQVLRFLPGTPLANLTQTQGNPTSNTPLPTPTPVHQVKPFQPDGTGPTTQQCERSVGGPCYSPEQIQQAFNLPALYREGYDGTGQTIVILGAGNTDTIEADLHHFDQVWGLPDPPSFKVSEPQGPPSPYTCPDKADELRLESTLDVEWAHAIAPGANIVLLIGSNDAQSDNQADNCSFYGLETSLNYALYNQIGNVVTISYGGSELGVAGETESEKSYNIQDLEQEDAIIKEATKNGITVLASTGDNGVTNPNGSNNGNGVWQQPNVSWPASDPYVLAVGGTTLQVKDTNGDYGSERAWHDQGGGATGGGLSAIFPEPLYQEGLPQQNMLKGQRGIPDVSFPAEPSFDLYASFESGIMGQVSSKWDHWDIIGGTSASSPCWAGLIAIADQMRGKPLGLIQPALYSLRGKGMHDITSGNNSNGGVSGYQALPGYDLVSGWGTPIADQFLSTLIQLVDAPPIPCQNTRSPCS